MAPEAARNVRLLYVFWFLRDFQLWIPVWIVFLTLERGFSLTQVTLAEGLFLVGVIVLEVPTGAVADRWGRSRSLALGAFTLGVAILIYAFTQSFAVLLTSFMIWSVAQTLMSGADMALLFDTLKRAGNEAAYERIAGRGAALNWAGAGFATLLGGPVAALLDIRATIIFGAGTCIVTGLVALALWDPPHVSEGPKDRYLKTIQRAFREAWSATDVRTVILLSGTTYAAIEGSMYLIQPYLVDRDLEVGVMFSLLQVPLLGAGIAGSLLAARLQGRAGTVVALLTLPLAGAGAYLALATMPGLGAYPAFPALFLLAACIYPIATGYVNRRVDSERRATVLSMQGMVGSLVLAGLAPAIGFVTDEFGISWAFTMGGLLTLAALLVFGPPLLARREPAVVASPNAVGDA